MRGAVRLALLLALATGCATTRPVRPADGVEAAPAPHPELQLEEAEPPPPAAPPPRPERHTVAAGQNLYRISLMYGCETKALMEANGIKDPRTLKVGQVLRIPACEGPAVEVAPPPVATEAAVASASGSGSSSPLTPSLSQGERGRGSLAWPLRGVLYGRFGKKGKEPHDGIDLAAPEGTPVRAAAPGVVLYAGEQRGYGNIVLVEHANGLITLYAHNRDVRVRTGQTVRDGQVVATVGESGRTSGPHLHFEVRREGVPVDPLGYLGPVPSS